MDMSNPAVAKLVAVTVSLIALITLSVSVRFFVRSVLLRSVDWDDVLVFLSYSLTVLLCSCVLAMTNFGFGTPVDDVSGDDLRQFLKLQFVTQLAYVWGFVTVKMSFAVLYLRLFRGHVSQRMNQLLLAVLAAEGFEETMVVIFHCKPVDKTWNPQKEGTCLNLKLFYYISFAIKFVTDVCLFIQPIPAVWKLQLSKAKRLGAILMLSLGLFVCIIAIIRVSFISQLRTDVTKDLVVPMVWSQVEVSILVVCASIPSLRPFLQCFPAVSKALGLSSSKDSRPTSNVGRSPRVVSLHMISWSKAKQSHVETNNPIHISTGCNVTATGSWSAHSSTENIFPQRHSGPSGIVVTHDVEVGVERVDAGERLSNDQGQIDAVEDRALHHIGDSI
ncbi:uncharacterized protein BKA55DRAFT_587264 [Fusarium redolens]|uniref:Rhodopsin domain-containing protein n=1 Tax=Fusarium redolens TaxID=48865 RepID=A0A9P9FWC0_FUSRE|nr:uncharacterized protein BKA55DRAFT_587264 [Fusarium redolens]KAH7205155.1 hypothetical protein BKA55DRAFT_587264 [Fusarium redolens]